MKIGSLFSNQHHWWLKTECVWDGCKGFIINQHHCWLRNEDLRDGCKGFISNQHHCWLRTEDLRDGCNGFISNQHHGWLRTEDLRDGCKGIGWLNRWGPAVPLRWGEIVKGKWGQTSSIQESKRDTGKERASSYHGNLIFFSNPETPTTWKQTRRNWRPARI